MSGRATSSVSISVVTLAVAFAAAVDQGDPLGQPLVPLLILSLGASVCAAFALRPDPSILQGHRALAAALLFPAYVAFQLIPLPLFIVRVLDPTRAEIANSLRIITSYDGFAAISIMPGQTWAHLGRIVSYALIFLLVRAAARNSQKSVWFPAVPLIAIGGLEAALGLVQHFQGAEVITGTYLTKDLLAGMLEMVLPLAMMYAIALLNRRREHYAFAASSVIKASVFFACASGMFVTIVFSLSKGGFLATLVSLFIMGFLGWVVRLPGPKKWLGSFGLAALVLLLFVLLPTNELTRSLSGASNDPTVEGRLPIAMDTLHFFSAYPLLGAGLGTFPTGLLRYETYGFQVGWANAHNDYLQLLAELGVVGFLIPAALMCAIFARAVRTSLSATTPETRFLGLACSGSIAAMLIHSFADFNMYVPANAMVLSWIAAISAALPAPVKPGQTERSFLTPSFLRGVVLILGSFGSIYAGAWLVFLHSFKGDFQAERSFCRFGICDSDETFAALVQQHGGNVTDLPQASIVEFVQRDPAGPNHWCDLGESFQKTGRTQEARSCFSRALALGPRIPYILFRNARFHFGIGESGIALHQMVHALEGDASYDNQVFAEYEKRKIPIEELLRSGLPADPAIWRSYIAWEITQKHVADAITVWNQLVSRGYVNDATANNFVNFLLGQKKPEAAMQAWALYAGSRSPGYPETERVFNGDFESDPLPQPVFDWWMEKTPGAAIGFDTEIRHAGARSLRVEFDGTQNLTGTGLRQTVVLKPGRYRFSAWVRSNDLSTDEGVALNVVGQDGPGPNFTSEAVKGSTDWKLVEREIVAPPGTSLAMIRLTRKPSLKFDNLLRGMLWMDQVSIRPEK